MAQKKRGRGRPPSVPPSKRVEKVSVALPRFLIEDLKWKAKQEGTTFSGLLRRVLESYMGGKK